MKILFMIDSLKAGGKERQLLQILKYITLNNKNYSITLILLSKKVFFKEIYNLDINIEYITENSKNPFFIFNLIKLLKKYKPDIIHTWDIVSTFYTILLIPFFKYKLLNGTIRHGIKLNKFSHNFRTFLAKISPFVLANSEAGLIVNGLKRDNRHFVLYNGIDKKFKNNKKINSLKNQEIIKFVSVSSLTPYKDYFTVIEALEKLKNDGFKFVYNIIGEGPLKTSILNIIKEKKLENYIFLLGIIKNVEDYLSEADIFIHSSRGEGCSNAILEAMYSGLPIIATNTGGTKEIVTQKNGLLFEYKNPNELYNKLKYLLENPEKRKIFSNNSRKIVENNFTSETMINNYINILKKLKNFKHNK